uniref:Protein kinase domain-containing protein n=1 Tax=Neogobius melanostomus TaxID=47308 RepID=A0A8C6SRL4_9GOBI
MLLCFSPEVVKNEPYGEKADVWALGCVLYQMVTLRPPFYSSNMLSLANKIVEAQFEPVDSGSCPDRVVNMIRCRCLSPEPEQRPDIVEVSSKISDLLLKAMDHLHTSHNALERRAQRDRKRAHMYFRQRNHSAICSAPTEVTYLSSSLLFLFTLLTRFNLSFADQLCCFDNSHSSGSTLAGLCVSPSKVRQIDDPVNRLLLQLHKILFITQLPPAPPQDSKRHLVERFKKALFNRRSDPHGLRGELSKVFIMRDTLMFQGQIDTPHAFVFAAPPDVCRSDGAEFVDGVTYEQMQVSDIIITHCTAKQPD